MDADMAAVNSNSNSTDQEPKENINSQHSEETQLGRSETVDQRAETDACAEHNMSGIEICADELHKSSTESQNHDSYYSMTVTDLPLEILLHIASFLKPQEIVCSLCQVCKTLYDIFSHDHYWRTRITVRWPQKYPVLDREDFNWQKACMEREEIHSQWSDPGKNFTISCSETASLQL